MRNLLNRLLSKVAFIAPGGGTIRPFLHKLRGVKVGKNVWISQYVYLDEIHPEALTIGDNSTIGLRTSVFTHFYWGGRRRETNMGGVTIERDVFIGPHCVILPNVRIGAGSVIKAGTVVAKDVPAETFFGNPPPVPLGHVTIPLTSENEFEKFIQGIRPVRNKSSRKSVNTGE